MTSNRGWLPNAPNPGSDAVLDLDCTCPVLANNHGHQGLGREGLLLGGWWITENCPLHDVREKEGEDGHG